MSTVAGRRLPRALWLMSAAFILYGGTIPFNFAHDNVSAAHRLSGILRTTPWALHAMHALSLPDVVQNVLLFVPFGVFGALSMRRSDYTRGLVALVVVTVLGAVVSGTVEVLQLFTSDRTASITDLATNTFGAAAGVMGVLVFEQSAMAILEELAEARLLDPATFYPALVFLVIVCLSIWEPFDVTLDVSTVGHKIRALQRDIWQFGGIDDEGIAALQFALFAGALCGWLRAIRAASPVATALSVGLLAAFGLEASQVLITARQPGLEDALVHAAGVFAGVGAWHLTQGAGRRVRLLPALAIGTAIGTALQMLAPFTIVSHYRPVQWIPFLNYYAFTSFNTVSHTVELFLIYLPLGFVAVRESSNPRRGMLIGAMLAFAIAAPIEYAQGWIAGRYADVTDVTLSVAGALIGAWAAQQSDALLQAVTTRHRGGRYVATPTSDHSTSSKQAT